MKIFIPLSVFVIASFSTKAQNVGIGTNTPQARLHVLDSNVIFSATGSASTTNSGIPTYGAGRRFFWYAEKGAFRAGFFNADSWQKDSIGTYSVALGGATRAIGSASFASGNVSIARGNTSTAMGYGAETNGASSAAIGFYTVANADFSAAIGNQSVANGNGSMAFGWGNVANGVGGTVVGSFNDPVLATGQTSLTSSTPVFIVGNGTAPVNRSNAMIVLQNGNIGIGTNQPAANMHIRTNSTITYPHLLLEESENDYARLSFKNTNTSNFWSIAGSPQATGSNASLNFYYQGFGDVLSLRGNGNATLYGTLTQSSDARLKTDIQPLEGALASLQQINGYSYNWKNAQMDQEPQIGVLAQEVQQVFPDLVKTDDSGTLSVNYSGLIPVLINAVKEQEQELNRMRQENDELKKRLDRIEKRL